MTSALIVLPVPESPANRAVIPVPRPPPGRIRHAPSTSSRWRARSARPRRLATVGGGSTRSSHPTAGSMRRARRSRRAAFCWRAPRRTSAASIERASRSAIVAAAAAAWRMAPAPRRYGAVDVGGVEVERRRHGAQGLVPDPRPRLAGQLRGLDDVGRAVGPARLPTPLTGEQQRHRRGGEALDGRDVGLGEHVDRPGRQRAAAQPGLANRGVEDLVGVRRRGDPHEVDGDERHPGRVHGVGHQVHRRLLTIVEVGEGAAAGEDPHQRIRRRLGGGLDVDEDERQRRVGAVAAEHVGGDAIGHPQGAGEERPIGVVDLDQPGAHEPPAGFEAAASRRHRSPAARTARAPARC